MLSRLDHYKIHLSDCTEQGYDCGSNMAGTRRMVFKHVCTEKNNVAEYSAYGVHLQHQYVQTLLHSLVVFTSFVFIGSPTG